jgi:hypothetical protein
MNNRRLTSPDFGEPLDLETLLDFAEIDEDDLDDAIDWFDEHASEEWVGALENKPIGKAKR